MKKSLILVGLLSIGYAHAQEGRVGINTETPTATLNVKSKTGNTKDTKNFELENADGTKMLTVLDNGKIGVNNVSPEYRLDIIGLGGEYYNNHSMAIRTFRNDPATSGGIDLFRARGTKDAPQKIEKNDQLSSIKAVAYTGTKNIKVTSISSYVTGDPTENSVPSSIAFDITKERATAMSRIMTLYHTGNVGIGIGEPTNRLHIKPNTGLDPVRLEGLQVSTEVTDKVVVVDASGVLKTVERGSIGGGSQGLTSEVDGIVGNEVLDATAGRGLVRAGSGTANAPYTLGVADGGIATGMLAAGAVTGDKIANAAITANKLGIAGTDGQVLTYKNGAWTASTPAATGLTQEVDGVIGNEVADVIANRGLERKGTGTQNDPYKVGLITGTKDGDTLVWSQTENKWKVQASQNSAGKVIKKFRTVALPLAAGDWTDDDFTIRITGQSATFELPDPATNAGRVIALRNGEGTNRTMSKNQPINNGVIKGNSGMLLHSDGERWHVIGGF